jgi:hypothetical protein
MKALESSEIEAFLRPMFQDMINKFSEFENNFYIDVEANEFYNRSGNRLILQKCWAELWVDIERMCLNSRTHKILLPSQISRLLEVHKLVSDLFDEFGYKVRAQESDVNFARIYSLLCLLSGPSSSLIETWEHKLTDSDCVEESDRLARRPHISRVILRKVLKSRKKYLFDSDAILFLRDHRSHGGRLKRVLGLLRGAQDR